MTYAPEELDQEEGMPSEGETTISQSGPLNPDGTVPADREDPRDWDRK